MKPTTQIRRAIRLFLHLEDLLGLGHLEPQDVLVLSNALIAWIGILHTQMHKAEQPTALLQPDRSCTYRLHERQAAPTRLMVEEAGQPVRALHHVPIFCPWGFGTESMAAHDTALAILADYFGEPLSRRSFLQGQGRACQYYPALAAALHTRPHRTGITTHEITTIVQRSQQTRHATWEHGEQVW